MREFKDRCAFFLREIISLIGHIHYHIHLPKLLYVCVNLMQSNITAIENIIMYIGVCIITDNGRLQPQSP